MLQLLAVIAQVASMDPTILQHLSKHGNPHPSVSHTAQPLDPLGQAIGGIEASHALDHAPTDKGGLRLGSLVLQQPSWPDHSCLKEDLMADQHATAIDVFLQVGY